jgi:hypothetical protein
MKNTLRELVNRCERCGPSAECPIVASLDEEGTNIESIIGKETTVRHTIDIFSAGCATCQSTIDMVKKLAGAEHDVKVHDMHQRDVASQASTYGIGSVPAVVIDGKLAGCCAERGPDERILREALR